MKIFTRLSFLSFFLFLAFVCFGQPWPQGASLVAIQSSNPPGPSVKTNFNVTPCGGSTLNLDATVAPEIPAQGANSGSMNNDTWIAFKALSTTVKVRVCDPSFDAAVEVYKISDQTMVASFNIAGNGGREYSMVNGLEVNSNYAVRIGRYTGSGAGTFTFNVEYFSVYLNASYSPGYAGSSCYAKTQLVKRNSPTTTPSGDITNTRWKFTNGTVNEACVTGTNSQLALEDCLSPCLGDQYMVSCEAKKNDAECGSVWWGYSIERPISICDPVCPSITQPANNSSIASIRTTLFKSSNVGNGALVQWRFVTDNGNTELCSPWISGPLHPYSIPSFGDCLEYGKFYDVSLRVKYCSSDPEPDWCNHISVFSQPIPRFSIEPSLKCTWRTKGTATLITNGPGSIVMHQYRIRFTPVANPANPCPSQNLAPIGPAIVTGWIASPTIFPPNALQKGTIYNVQMQGRFQNANCSNCQNGTFSVPLRMIDWGPPCLVGMRTDSGPAHGSPLSCGCNIGAMMMDDWDEEAYSALIDEFGIIEVDVPDGEYPDDSSMGEETLLSVHSIDPSTLHVDLSNMNLNGDAELRIHDLNGRLITSRKISSNDELSTLIIQLNRALSTGIYAVSVTSDEFTLTQKLFILGQ